jgi:ABC-type phosphate/phosphonate transport system substrate-binding protein
VGREVANCAEKTHVRRMNVGRRQIGLWVYSAILLWGVILPWGGTGCGEERKLAPLPVGYSSKVFADVDLENAKVVTKVWTDILTKQSGYEAGAAVTFYQDLQSLEKDVKTKKADLVIVTAHEYVEIASRVAADPITVSESDGGVYEEMVFLTRKEKAVSYLKDLRNRPIAVPKGLFMTACQLWLETCLMREGIVTPRTFFTTLKEVQKPSQAVLQVFFQQVDGCIVNRNAFNTMGELNPQVSKELVPLFAGPGIPGGVTFLRGDLNEQEKKDIIKTLTSMHTTPQGKQLLTFFRKKRLVPFRSEYLRAIEALMQENQDLRMRMAKKGQ